jgi:hypothetical protein
VAAVPAVWFCVARATSFSARSPVALGGSVWAGDVEVGDERFAGQEF